jgi:hypothetical protein
VEHETKIEDSADRRTVFAANRTVFAAERTNPPGSGHLSHWPAASEPRRRHVALSPSGLSRSPARCLCSALSASGLRLGARATPGRVRRIPRSGDCHASIDRRKPTRPGINQRRWSECGSVAHSSFGQVELDAKFFIYSPSCERPLFACAVRRPRFSSGCKTHPANAPAGSNRSSHGGNEMAEAFGVARHIQVTARVCGPQRE